MAIKYNDMKDNLFFKEMGAIFREARRREVRVCMEKTVLRWRHHFEVWLELEVIERSLQNVIARNAINSVMRPPLSCVGRIEAYRGPLEVGLVCRKCRETLPLRH